MDKETKKLGQEIVSAIQASMRRRGVSDNNDWYLEDRLEDDGQLRPYVVKDKYVTRYLYPITPDTLDYWSQQPEKTQKPKKKRGHGRWSNRV